MNGSLSSRLACSTRKLSPPASGICPACGTRTTFRHRGGVPEYIEAYLADQHRGARAPWAIVSPEGSAIGVTTFLHPDPTNRNIEIGSTWIAKNAQGGKFNKAAKLLLLQRAFVDLGCLRVEIRTHYMNRQSRAAIEGLGAKLDGVLRRHKILASGLVRDTCVYSILDIEWPEVKTSLKAHLNM